ASSPSPCRRLLSPQSSRPAYAATRADAACPLPMQAPANTLALRPDPTAVASALQWLEGIAEREGWPPRASFGLTLCLDEALTNVISYAFDPPEPGIEPAITVSWRNDRAGIVVELRDNGRPYDPTADEPPPLAA